jgi:hypothetical protein
MKKPASAAQPVTEVFTAKSAWLHMKHSRPMVFLTSPLIYFGIVFFWMLDLFVTVYQLVCFPANGIPKVRRADYLIYDRARLPYLNVIEKLGCYYCSYANGLLAYVTEITARTEQHFCPIRHHVQVIHPHSRYSHFVPYGDARAYHTTIHDVRNEFIDIKPAKGDGEPRG